MRLSLDTALRHGLLSEDDARVLRGQGRQDAHRLRARLRRATGENSPQARLQALMTGRWPDDAVPECKGAVPGRRFRLDVGFPRYRLAVECDGWEHHGKYKSDFKRDRERDRLLLLNGWRPFRFYASEILHQPDTVVSLVERMIAEIEGDA